jgi:NAD+ diphosphatase
MHWEKRSRFCSSCGSKLERIPGTWGKQCTSCRAQHYPHIHPCIIVLVRKGNEFLLVRKVGDAEGHNRLIAGFVEFGESLEECVQREVREEAGIEVTNIQYAGSQNWPFPSQHMIGFLAEYAGGEIKPDGVEVEDVRWFTPSAFPRDPAGIRSIARWMMHVFGRSERLEVS